MVPITQAQAACVRLRITDVTVTPSSSESLRLAAAYYRDGGLAATVSLNRSLLFKLASFAGGPFSPVLRLGRAAGAARPVLAPCHWPECGLRLRVN